MFQWEGDVELQNLSVHLMFEGLTKLLVPITMEQGDLYLNMKIPGRWVNKWKYVVYSMLYLIRMQW